MKPVNQIYADFLLGNVKFHRVIETDMFRDALMFYMDAKYSTSAILCAVLYEMIFTTRLIRETANPKGFVPGKDNIDEQIDNLITKEEEVVNIRKMSFRSITDALVNEGVISAVEKSGYDKFYSDIRNPVAHGLTHRLYEPMIGRKPAHSFETETNYQHVYRKASELLINEIYTLMAIKVLRKQ